MSASTTIKCDKCLRESPLNDCQHWAHLTFKSTCYCFDEGTVDESTKVDLCPACKKLFTGFLKNCEYGDTYKMEWDAQGCGEKVSPNC